MKNLLLQHWQGPENELVQRSFINMGNYAKSVGAEHRVLRGPIFDPSLTPPCQKIYMLNEEFDEYDKVVMVDADMFVRKGMNENVFVNTGIGRHTAIQTHLRKGVVSRGLGGNEKYPYWGGSIYCLTKEQRQLFRSHLPNCKVHAFSGNYEDEGIMHRLAVLSKYPEKGAYLECNKWNRGSFEEGIEEAAFIHIRTKRVQGGPKYPKLDNLNLLVKRGLIDA